MHSHDCNAKRLYLGFSFTNLHSSQGGKQGYYPAPAVAQLVPAFIVISCSVGSAYWVLIGGAIFKTHAACFMCTVCLADPERWAVDIKARVEV